MQTSMVYGLVGCLVLSVGCAKDSAPSAREPAASQGAEATPEPQLMTMGTDPAAAPAEEPSTPLTPPDPIPAPDAPLSDAQLIGIVQALNAGEIEEAKLAKTRAKDARVKQFAAQMITHHGENQRQIAQLSKTQGATAAESSVANDLNIASRAELDMLKDASTADFDAMYMSNQVKQHDTALDMLTNRLIPAASDPKLRDLLESTRVTVAKHLKSANDIQQALLSASTMR